MQTVDAPWTGIIFLCEDNTYPIIPVKKVTSDWPLRDDKLTSFPCLTGLKKNCQVSLFAQQRKKTNSFFVSLAWSFFLLFLKTSDSLGRN